MSVTIAVPIADDLIPLLEKKARTAGLDREHYIRALVFRDIKGPPDIQGRRADSHANPNLTALLKN